MARQSFTPWQPSPLEQMVGLTPHTGGPPIHIRDALDARRLSWRTVPGEDYPSGYLGTNAGSRHAKLTPLQRTNARSYHRGVHAGSRVAPENYLWPVEFNMMSGIENQATTGMRFVPIGMRDQEAQIEHGVNLVNDGKPGAQDLGMGALDGGRVAGRVRPLSDIQRRESMKRMLPTWR